MRLEKGVISNTQLMFLILSFMQSMIITVNFSYSLTVQDTWIAVLIAFAISILVALIYLAIAKKYSGKDLVQINDAVLGPYIGKIVSVLYIWFFFALAIHYSYFFNSFWITYIMPETPRIAFLTMLIFVCAMAVRDGIEVIARCAFLMALIVGFMIILVFFFLVEGMEINNLLPLLTTPPKDFIQSVHILLAIPFLDIIVFLVILPYTADNKKVKKPYLIAMCISTVFLLISVVGNVAFAGPRVINSTFVSFAVAREIEIGEILTRLDVLIALTLFITIFIKVAIFYYATVISLARILKLRSYQPLVIPIGILIIAISVNLYESDVNQVYAARYTWPFNAAIHQLIIPIILLITASIRKLIQKRGESE